MRPGSHALRRKSRRHLCTRTALSRGMGWARSPKGRSRPRRRWHAHTRLADSQQSRQRIAGPELLDTIVTVWPVRRAVLMRPADPGAGWAVRTARGLVGSEQLLGGRRCVFSEPGGLARRSRSGRLRPVRPSRGSDLASLTVSRCRLSGCESDPHGSRSVAALREKVRARLDDMLRDRIELARVQLHHVLVLDVVRLVDELLEGSITSRGVGV